MTTQVEERVSAPPREREDAREERERRARVLEAAALEIEVRGWCRKSAIQVSTGRVCMVGAAHFASGGNAANSSDGYGTLAEVWGLKVPGEPLVASVALRLPNWNDRTGRTAAEVTFLLRWRAAEIRDGL